MTSLMMVLILPLLISVVVSNVFAVPLESNGDIVIRQKRLTPLTPCSSDIYQIIKSLRNCCDKPVFMKSTFENCYEASLSSLSRTLAPPTTPKMKLVWGDFTSFQTQLNSMMKKTQEDIQAQMTKRLEEKPHCIHECVFRNQSLLTSSGNIDKEAVATNFLANLDDYWKPVVKTAIDNCASELSKATLPTLAPNVIICNLEPVRFMTCIQRKIFMKCPKFEDKSSTCSSNLKQLVNCNPFGIQIDSVLKV